MRNDLKTLTEPNTLEAKKIVAKQLLAAHDRAAVAALRNLLARKAQPDVVQAIAMAVAETDQPPPELIQPLIQCLATDQVEVRQAVVEALACYHNHGLAQQLRTIAVDATRPAPQRLGAVAVLATFADRASMQVLIDLLDAPDASLARAAQAGLRGLAGVPYGSDVAAWRRWWRANKNGWPAQWLAEQNDQLSQRLRAVTGRLVKSMREAYHLGSEAERVERIAEYLDDSVPEVRLLGIELVNALITDGKPVPDAIVAQLRTLIEDSQSQVRLQAVEVIRDLRNKDDAELLLVRFASEVDPDVRQAIVKALGWLGDPAAIPVLLKVLARSDAQMAGAAASSLGLLCQQPNGNNTGEVDISDVAAALKRHLGSASEKTLQQTILETMAKIAHRSFRSEFLAGIRSSDAAWRLAGVEGLSRLGGNDDAAVVTPLLADKEAAVREVACRALSRLGGPEQVALLIKRCDEGFESDEAVRRAAKESAVNIMFRLELAALEKTLSMLLSSGKRIGVVAEVLEAASVQASAGEERSRSAVLTAALASAKYATGDKQSAASLWTRVLLAGPRIKTARSLGKVLLELGRPELILGAVEQVAGGRPEALADLLSELASGVRALSASEQQAGFVQDLAKPLAGTDVSNWPEPAQEAMKALLAACAAVTPEAPAAEPADAAAPGAATKPAGSVQD